MPLQAVRNYAAAHQLFKPEGRYLVALSGGADSVALLLIMEEMGLNIEAAHCNFHLRGDESVRDEEFCVDLCGRHNIPLHRVHFNTEEHAQLHHISIEMSARQLRYRYFSQLLRDINATAVCVAHHRDDSVETLLLNLLRGTGFQGLTGIHPVAPLPSFDVPASQEKDASTKDDSPLFILRPLLCLSRADIESYLAGRHQPFVTDSTNLDPDAALRNRIRLQLLPLMNEMVPSATENIQRTISHLQQALPQLNHSLELSRQACLTMQEDIVSISVEKLLEQPSPEYTLYYILKDYHFTPAQITQAYSHLHAPTGRHLLSSSHQLVFHRGHLLVAPLPQPLPTLRIPEPGTYIYDNRYRVRIQRHESQVSSPSQSSSHVCLFSELPFPLILRPLRTGDRFTPFGMKGTKLVSDYLTNAHRSIIDRQRQLVLTDADDNILWLVGERRAEGHRVTPQTQQFFTIEVEPV
ncbi:MAG: tRNA lysidine(34) synthetase TilS [Prevotella sp.]|nr:tRNA lysidine(34) synthetase TilS [Prevotella sp.]